MFLVVVVGVYVSHDVFAVVSGCLTEGRSVDELVTNSIIRVLVLSTSHVLTVV